MSKKISDKKKEEIRLAAEKLARLFWRQIQYEHKKSQQLKILIARENKNDMN